MKSRIPEIVMSLLGLAFVSGCDRPVRTPSREITKVSFKTQDGSPVRLLDCQLGYKDGFYQLADTCVEYDEGRMTVGPEPCPSVAKLAHRNGRVAFVRDGELLGYLDPTLVDAAEVDIDMDFGWDVRHVPRQITFTVAP